MDNIEYDIFIEYTKWWGLVKHCESIEGMTEETFLQVYEDNRPHSEDYTTVKLVDGCIDSIDNARTFYRTIQRTLQESREADYHTDYDRDYDYHWRGEFTYGKQYTRGDVFMYRMNTYVYTGPPWEYREGRGRDCPDIDPDCVLLARTGVKEVYHMDPVSCSAISEGEAWSPPAVSPFHRIRIGDPGWSEELYSAQGNIII